MRIQQYIHKHEGLIKRIHAQEKLKRARPTKSKPYRKKLPEFSGHQKKAYERRISENKSKYKRVYEEFFKRGGAAWYESLTGSQMDLEKIYLDIWYLKECLDIGVCAEEAIQKRRKSKISSLLESGRATVDYSDTGEPVLNIISGQNKRRNQIILATPNWVNMKRVKEIYQERDRLNQESEETYEVDHIVPVCHKKVCGLHVEFNLRVISKTDNRAKSNKFEI